MIYGGVNNMIDFSDPRDADIYWVTLEYLNRCEAGTETGIQKALVKPEMLEKLIYEGKCEIRYEDGFYFVKKANRR